MLGQHSFQPQRETCLESRGKKCALPAPLMPRQNQHLAALSREDYERLLLHLELVTLPVGWNAYGAGDRQNTLYFIISGIVSKYCVTVNGTSSQCALKGSEGAIGVALFLVGDSSLCQTLVLSAGHAYRLALGTEWPTSAGTRLETGNRF